MSLLGEAAMVFWHDITDGDDDYKDWHSNEHMSERVGVPGFLRGRRARSLRGEPQYFIMYEVDSVEVLTSRAYLDRLNDPSPWTEQVLSRYRNSNRTLCRLDDSRGLGAGRFLVTCRMAPAEESGDLLRHWLQNTFLEQCVSVSSIVGAHFLTADEVASHTPTEEKKLRSRPDEIANWVVIVEGYDEDAMQAVMTEELAAEHLERLGALPGSQTNFYELEHIASATDVKNARAGRVNGSKR